LPALKQLRRELTGDTLARFWDEKFTYLQGKVDMVGSSRENSQAMSKAYGVETRYLRTICTGTLRAGEEVAVQHCYRRPTTDRRSSIDRRSNRPSSLIAGTEEFSLPLAEEVLVIWSGGVSYFYAWLDQSAFEYFAGAGSSMLLSWFSDMDMPPSQPSQTVFNQRI